ncbi:MAG: sel1 repeat family protein [Idiomarina sp.]|nr:sel1 repeat family protein [Idiomarina sp.]
MSVFSVSKFVLSSLVLPATLAFGMSAATISAPAQAVEAEENLSACEGANCEEIMRRFMRLSRGGSGDASALVAVGFANGEGFEQDHKEAARFINMGVRQQSGLAAYIKSDWLRRGFILEQDMAEALQLLETAINLNHAPAMHQKGVLLMQADDLEGANRPLLDEAIGLFIDAADLGLASSMYALARLLHAGVGVDQNIEEAAELYRQLTLSGHPGARQQLRQLTRELEASSGNDALVERLVEADNMERIQVYGSTMNFNAQLEGLARRLDATGVYDTRSVGSRIRGVSCDQTGANCQSGRPAPGASSLAEVLSGRQGQ